MRAEARARCTRIRRHRSGGNEATPNERTNERGSTPAMCNRTHKTCLMRSACSLRRNAWQIQSRPWRRARVRANFALHQLESEPEVARSRLAGRPAEDGYPVAESATSMQHPASSTEGSAVPRLFAAHQRRAMEKERRRSWKRFSCPRKLCLRVICPFLRFQLASLRALPRVSREIRHQ